MILSYNSCPAQEGIPDERMQRLVDSFVEMRTGNIEAEVYWGRDKINELLTPVSKCCAILKAKISEYHWIRSEDHPAWRQVDLSLERIEEIERIVFEGMSEEDSFAKKLHNAISRAEDFLRHRVNA